MENVQVMESPILMQSGPPFWKIMDGFTTVTVASSASSTVNPQEAVAVTVASFSTEPLIGAVLVLVKTMLAPGARLPRFSLDIPNNSSLNNTLFNRTSPVLVMLKDHVMVAPPPTHSGPVFSMLMLGLTTLTVVVEELDNGMQANLP